MNNFYLLDKGIDMSPAMLELKAHPELWNANTLRTRHEGTARAQVSDIWMRFNQVDTDNADLVIDDKEAIAYPAWEKLPVCRGLVMSLMARASGLRLGRVIITKLRPGGRIEPHVDMGAPADYYDRFHIVLQGLPGNLFGAGDEQVQMLTGECWWFDNKQEHGVMNNSADDRVHIVVDLLLS